MAEVRLTGLEKCIRGTAILHPLTLTVRDGEFFVLVGPSGCGKSTLLHLLAGLDQPTSGQIYFDDEEVTHLEPRDRDVALVFQSYALYPHLTVAENLTFPLEVAPRHRRLNRSAMAGEVSRIAELLGLSDLLNRRPRELSGGQRQRVALGRALIRTPRLFLLDEPLSNLDMQLRASMRAELRRLHEELHITTIYVTHDQTEAMTLGDRLAVLYQGRIQQIGQPREMYARPANLFVASFVGYPPMNLLRARPDSGGIQAGPLRFAIPSDAPIMEREMRVMAGVRPEDISIGPSKTLTANGAAGGIVRLLESSGPTWWVTVDVRDGESVIPVVGTAVGGFVPQIGDEVSVSAPKATVHLFDPASGDRY